MRQTDAEADLLGLAAPAQGIARVAPATTSDCFGRRPPSTSPELPPYQASRLATTAPDEIPAIPQIPAHPSNFRCSFASNLDRPQCYTALIRGWVQLLPCRLKDSGSWHVSSRRSLFFVVFVLRAIRAAGNALRAKRSTPAHSRTPIPSPREPQQFTQVYETIEQNYADPVNPDKAIYNGAIPSMLHQLDPHSNFFDPKSYSALREEQRGKYYGVGMTVGPRNNKVIVIAPFVGTPAYRAGIPPPATSSPPSMATHRQHEHFRRPPICSRA